MKYFKIDEFRCKCGLDHPSPMSEELLEKLDKAREDAGVAFNVTSGFRCPNYNRRLEERGYTVSKDSSHMKGLAADISFKKATKDVILGAMRKHFKRIGVDDVKMFVHVDVDKEKPQKEWRY